MKNVTNVKVTNYDPHSLKFALCCEYGGARYHVWCIEHPNAYEDCLYKNPPRSIDYGAPGYFKTRRLSTDSAFGRRLIGDMIFECVRLKLVDKARAALFEEAEKARIEREKAARIHRVKMAGPELYKALVRIVREFDCGRTPTASDVSAARDAVAKAEATS